MRFCALGFGVQDVVDVLLCLGIFLKESFLGVVACGEQFAALVLFRQRAGEGKVAWLISLVWFLFDELLHMMSSSAGEEEEALNPFWTLQGRHFQT